MVVVGHLPGFLEPDEGLGDRHQSGRRVVEELTPAGTEAWRARRITQVLTLRISPCPYHRPSTCRSWSRVGSAPTSRMVASAMRPWKSA
jgi:hypothetical protein